MPAVGTKKKDLVSQWLSEPIEAGFMVKLLFRKKNLVG